MPTNTKALQVAEPAPFVAGKNKVINGDFGVWQRGTSFNLSNGVNTFTSDRWRVNSQYTSGTSTLTRQAFTPGNAITGYESQYYMRYTAASGTCSYADFFQPVEDVQTFAGQTVTISFWAKASVSTGVTVLFQQNFGSGGSGAVNTFGPAIFMTTSWARYTATVAIPSISGKTTGAGSNLLSGFYVGTHTSNQTIDIWGVQLEAGSVATPFQTATGTIQGELAACQRYFQFYGGEGTYQALPGLGTSQSATNHYFIFNFIQSMRTKPTLSLSAASDFGVTLLGVTSQPMTALAFTNTNEVSTNSAILQATTGSNASLGSNHPVAFGANNTTNARFNLSAEL